LRFGAWGLGLRVSYSESEVSWSESEVCLPNEDVGRREVVEETRVFVVVGGGHGYVQNPPGSLVRLPTHGASLIVSLQYIN
jgi:hypothetical protein